MDNANPKDHDLLIQIDTKLGRVIYDVQELKDDTVKRISNLEEEKENKTDVARLQVEANKLHLDHETRLRLIEHEQDNFKGKYAIIAGITVIILSAIVSWAFSMLNIPRTTGIQTTITSQTVPVITTTTSTK